MANAGLLLLVLCGHYILLSVVHAFSQRFRIGGIFDKDSHEVRTAFKYLIEKHNNSSSSFKLDKYEREKPLGDSYILQKAVCLASASGVMAFFGMTTSSTVDVIHAYTKTFHMPYVTPNPPVTELDFDSEYVLRMMPTHDQALIAVMKTYRWDKVFYAYDTREGLLRLQRILNQLQNEKMPLEISVTKLPNVTSAYSILRQLDAQMESRANKYIVLDVSSPESLQLLLRQIQNLGMNRAAYHYLLSGLAMDELDLSDFKHGGVNMKGFRLVNPESAVVSDIVKEWRGLNPDKWRGAGTDKIKLEAALTLDGVRVILKGLGNMLSGNPAAFQDSFRRGHLYNNGTRGIPCINEPTVPWKHGSSIMNSFKEVRFDGVTGTVAFDKQGMRTDFVLDVLELSLDNEPSKVGNWSVRTGLKLLETNKSRSPGSDGEGGDNKTQIITTIETDPYIIERKKPDNGEPLTGNARYTGYCAELAQLVAETVKFKYLLKLVKDKKYGVHQENGKWNGMVGELTMNEADIAIAPLTISSQRERVVDFSKPFMSLGISIMIKKPDKQKPGVFSFMDPLSSEIWMCIIFAYLGVSLVLFLVSRFSPYEWQIEDSVNGPTFTNDFTILNSLWFSLGAFMRQGCDVSPRLVR